MPTITDDAIALRHWEYSETSQTVALFMRTHGVLRAMAKGAKREKGQFSGGIEVLTRGVAVAIVKQTTDLATLTAWDLLTVYWRVRSELDAHRAGLYLVDLVYHAITDHDPHPGLYDALLGSLDGLERGEDLHEMLARFQWALLLEIGTRPELAPEMLGGSSSVYFQPGHGRVSTLKAPGSWPVRTSTIRFLMALDAGEDLESDDRTEDAKRAGRFLAEYLVVLLGRDLSTRRAIYGPTVAVRGS
ncbi:DNA repair protein RecO [Planctomycetaceae bacterium AH-315-I19]|nr:DNA repair protein RecO [Planctomycetaceae bacterium AH-315-I19]